MADQVGDHDQDSLYDLTINQMERQPEAGNGNQVGWVKHLQNSPDITHYLTSLLQIINGNKEKERKPSKIDIPFVVSIGEYQSQSPTMITRTMIVMTMVNKIMMI